MYRKSLLVLSVGLFSTSIFAQSASGDAVRQKMEDLQRRGTESRQQPTLQINPPTYQLNPKLKNAPIKNAPIKDATVDQYDCDSTCLSMGGNKTYQMTYIENQTARCPADYKGPSDYNHVIGATRKITKKYEGNTYYLLL